jgi:hypothetical protein
MRISQCPSGVAGHASCGSSHSFSWRLAVAVSVVMAALVAPAGAFAAAPVLLSVGQVSGHLTATWSLPPGVEAQVVEAAMNPARSSDGYFFFENVLAAGSFNTLTDTQTTWTDNFQNDPGTYYIHISGLDRSCYYADACPIREFSQMMAVTIPGAGVVTPPPLSPPPVATPSPDCIVPNVRGLTLRVARTRIVQRNCSVGVVRRAYSTTVRSGRVIKQTPRSGMALGSGSEVDFVVSRGRRR